MENKKKIITGVVVIGVIILAVVIAVLNNNKGNQTNETLQSVSDMKSMLNTIYKNLGDNIPSLDTEEITLDDNDLIKSLTGLESSDGIKTMVVSQPLMNAQALEVVVIKAQGNANVDNMMQNIYDNVNMRRWVCVEADKLYVARSGDVIFMVMADSDWAKSIYDEFVKYMDNKVDKTLEKDNSFDSSDIDNEFPNGNDRPVAD